MNFKPIHKLHSIYISGVDPDTDQQSFQRSGFSFLKILQIWIRHTFMVSKILDF